MATPRITIDALPEQATPTDDDMLMLQDSGVSKKVSIATLKGLTPTGLTAHLDDTADAHDAAAISTVPAGPGVDGTTVQAQLNQLAALVEALTTRVTALETP